MSLRIPFISTLLSAALVASAPALADVPTYTQYACHLPDGTPAPVDGFSPLAQGGATATNLCIEGGGLTIDLPTTATSGTRIGASWTYSPAPNAPIERLVYERTVSNIGAADSSTTRHWAGPSDACGPGVSCKDSATIDISTSAPLFELFLAQCDESDPCHGSASGDGMVSIHSVAISIGDDSTPAFVHQPSGDLFGDGPVGGTRSVTFSASDQGGGVYQAALVVDGIEQKRQVVDTNGGTCVKPFVRQIPCPGTAGGTLQLDTTKLPNGAHAVAVVVYDATAINSVTSSPITIDVRNDATVSPGDPNTAAAPDTESHHHTLDADRRLLLAGPASHGRIVSRFGKAATVKGWLVRIDGDPVAATKVEALSASTHDRLASATTDVAGRFRLTLVHPFSGRVLIRASGGPSETVRLIVRAPIALRASQPRLRNGQVLALTARTPARGAARVAFQVLIGKSWRTFAFRHLDPHGQARIVHRFRVTYTRVVYRFRALLLPGRHFAYAETRSAVASVIVN